MPPTTPEETRLLERWWRQDGRVWQCPHCLATVPTGERVGKGRWYSEPYCENGHRRRMMKCIPFALALDRVRSAS